ncbi:type I restriction endonuclease subunit S [Aeromonas hydrophila]|uniref:restriction endonuclease subunit S n=1 Tax=Aeromonas hydrophila TaxID=644 RepID=UPI0011163DDA|nr:restriction endonuclease subunit S [Aeromonas hydrophila]MCP3325781.1 restriction endonuclease subunit S [Aeromonas hydrophila]TNH91760.1 type I restriction endonuclease subunit S [Aeromonas hydrophila]
MQAYIPSTWAMSNIGAIADVVAGGTPKADDKSNFSAPGTGFAWLTPADLSGYMEKYISHGSRDLSEKGLATSSAKLMPAGALLFSSRAPIGYVAIAANKISTNQGFKNFVFSNEIASTYAYYFLKSIRGLAESLGTGTTFKEISGATAKTLPFVIPPFAEQKEISDRLDKLLAQVEATQARLARIPEIIKRFRQSVLSAAVSGKLTEEWRSKNTVNQPRKEKLASVVSFLDQGWSPKCINEPVQNNQWGVIKTSAVQPGFFLKEENKTLPEELKPRTALTLLKDDILITRAGPRSRCGITCIVDDDYPNLMICDKVYRIRTNVKHLLPQYLNWCLNSPTYLSYIEELKTGISESGMNMTQSKLNGLVINLPQVEEQTEIVRRVEQLSAYADSIELQAKAAKARVDKLTQAILAKAFRGELTADWRAANPDLISGENSAEALLALIQAERATVKPRKRASKPAISPTSSGVPQ